jgi:hypothetical protein
MKEKIESIFARVIPNSFTFVNESESFYDKRKEIKISISATSDEINRVKGQYPAHVSLYLLPDKMELTTQVFGGMGGGSIFRLPNKEIASERHLALKSIKIPFRRPSKNEKAVLAAIEKFAVNWREILKENLSVMPHGYDYESATKF